MSVAPNPATPNPDYDPFNARDEPNPTNDLETLMHLLKACLGNGILAIPYAFKHAGVLTGIILTCFCGTLCTYCIHILVRSAHYMLRRNRVPKYAFNQVVEEAMKIGPGCFANVSIWGSRLVDWFILINLYGSCVICGICAAQNVKDVMVAEWEMKMPCINLRCYILMLLPLLLILGNIRHLKFLAPFSAFANCVVLFVVAVVYYEVFREKDLTLKDVHLVETRVEEYPKYFGIAIFTLESVGVIIPLENTMKSPTNMIKFPCGVLNVGMGILVVLYTVTGCVGYIRWGENTYPNISRNLPRNWSGFIAKIGVSVIMIITYALKFYVPFEVTWRHIQTSNCNVVQRKPLVFEYLCRTIAVTMTVLVGVLIPRIGELISLVGALCLSFLGLICPAVADICVNHDSGKKKSVLIADIMIIIFGIFAGVSGTVINVLSIFNLVIADDDVLL